MQKVLVVEDDLSIASLITYNLEQAGYQIVTAHDGAVACTLVESFRPQLLTLDLLLPRRSGWQVLDFIRRHPCPHIADLPVIVVSILTSPRLRKELRNSGVHHCLEKPFSVTDLCCLTQTLLRGRPAAPVLSRNPP